MRPLEDLRIVVTRAAHQAEELAAPLRALGAEVILVPLIGIAPPLNAERLHNAAARSNEYDWIIFTSANAVHAFAAQSAVPPQVWKPRIAAVGPATRQAAEERGLRVDLTPPNMLPSPYYKRLAAKT
jgi:uroporphyrinogen-III synthase